MDSIYILLADILFATLTWTLVSFKILSFFLWKDQNFWQYCNISSYDSFAVRLTWYLDNAELLGVYMCVEPILQNMHRFKLSFVDTSTYILTLRMGMCPSFHAIAIQSYIMGWRGTFGEAGKCIGKKTWIRNKTHTLVHSSPVINFVSTEIPFLLSDS